VLDLIIELTNKFEFDINVNEKFVEFEFRKPFNNVWVKWLHGAVVGFNVAYDDELS
jgi:hypothetical protein